MQFCDRSTPREWVDNAVRLIDADTQRSADTHLLRYPLPASWPVRLYLKDESTHITGSLKHRLARSLFLYALCNGWVGPETTIIEASSGSTAVSEAYFAKLLGLDFIAVMPARTSPQKVALIEAHGGRCHFVDRAPDMYTEAQRLARECGGHYMDQFTHAERATDWRGNNNIAESIFHQLELESHPVPEWVVVGAGTGGTSATIGRYIRYRNLSTRLCVTDVENSVFYDAWKERTLEATCTTPSRIEGVGRPRVEPSFIPTVIDHMIKVPDAASIAAAHVLSDRLFRRVGASTGTNFFGLLSIAEGMMKEGREGSLVTLICDSGDRYAGTYFNADWLAQNKIDIVPWCHAIETFLDTGTLTMP